MTHEEADQLVAEYAELHKGLANGSKRRVTRRVKVAHSRMLEIVAALEQAGFLGRAKECLRWVKP